MTLPLNWWEGGGSDESKRKSISDALTISGQGILTNPTGHHQQVIMNSSSNLYSLQQQKPSQIVQPLGVQENGQSSGNGHHPSILGHQINGSSTNPSNGHSYSSSNQYQVEVRSSGSNVLLTSESGHPVLSDAQYQYPLEPVYGCRGLDSNPGSWLCFTGLEPKSKMFYLLSSLIIMGIAIMILTLIAAVVVFHQCESTLKTIPLTLFSFLLLFSFFLFFFFFSLSFSSSSSFLLLSLLLLLLFSCFLFSLLSLLSPRCCSRLELLVSDVLMYSNCERKILVRLLLFNNSCSLIVRDSKRNEVECHTSLDLYEG